MPRASFPSSSSSSAASPSPFSWALSPSCPAATRRSPPTGAASPSATCRRGASRELREADRAGREARPGRLHQRNRQTLPLLRGHVLEAGGAEGGEGRQRDPHRDGRGARRQQSRSRPKGRGRQARDGQMFFRSPNRRPGLEHLCTEGPQGGVRARHGSRSSITSRPPTSAPSSVMTTCPSRSRAGQRPRVRGSPGEYRLPISLHEGGERHREVDDRRKAARGADRQALRDQDRAPLRARAHDRRGATRGRWRRSISRAARPCAARTH